MVGVNAHGTCRLSPAYWTCSAPPRHRGRGRPDRLVSSSAFATATDAKLPRSLILAQFWAMFAQFSGDEAFDRGYRTARTTTHSGPSSPTNQSDGSTFGLPWEDMICRPSFSRSCRTTLTARSCTSQSVISMGASVSWAGGTTSARVVAWISPQPARGGLHSSPFLRICRMQG